MGEADPFEEPGRAGWVVVLEVGGGAGGDAAPGGTPAIDSADTGARAGGERAEGRGGSVAGEGSAMLVLVEWVGGEREGSGWREGSAGWPGQGKGLGALGPLSALRTPDQAPPLTISTNGDQSRAILMALHY